MATLGINYLSACEGGISFTIGTPEGEIGRRADSIKDGVELIKKYGIANGVFGWISPATKVSLTMMAHRKCGLPY